MLATKMRKTRRRRFLLRDTEGASLVEFAFIGPMLFLSAVGILEISAILTTQALMEGALREAARYGITGAGGSNRAQTILDIIDRHTLGFVDMETAEISTLTYNSFQSIGEPEPYTDENGNGEYDTGEDYEDVNDNGQWDEDQGAPGAGVANEIVLYTIAYEAPAMTGIFAHFFGEDGKLRLEATLPLKNEPFNNMILSSN